MTRMNTCARVAEKKVMRIGILTDEWTGSGMSSGAKRDCLMNEEGA